MKKSKTIKAGAVEKTSSKRYNKIGAMPYSYYTKLLRKAKSRNIDVTVTAEYIAKLFTKQKRRCALSGKRIYFTYGWNRQSASLDRINSKKGYEPGNVQWLHKEVNFSKQSLSQKKFLNMVRDIYLNKFIKPNRKEHIEDFY